MFNKEALEYLVQLGIDKEPIVEIAGEKYSSMPLDRIIAPIPQRIQATTLTALVDYIKSGMAEKGSYGDRLLIHVVSPTEVRLHSELREDCERETYMTCQALLPTNIYFNRFLDVESFNIMLQSSYVENEDRAILLKVTGTIQDKAVKEVGDDGVSQSVTMKTGVAKVGEVIVPNPVVLAPYRTFPEIEQPESKFIFRMQNGPTAALFEADGGAWRNEAMKRIKDYLFVELIEKAEMDGKVEIIS